MTKQMGLVTLLLLGLFAVGCGEVRKCKRGEQGCVGGPALDDGTCKAGLEPRGDAAGQNIKCVDPSADNCGCDENEVCSPDGKSCLNYCAAFDEPVEKRAVPPTCRKEDGNRFVLYDFESACRATCMQRCRRAELFCSGFTCDPSSCESAATLAACRLEVQAAQAGTACQGPLSNDVACITKLCEGIRDNDCNSFACPAGSQRDCAGVRCSNTCASSNIADGFCDDGDPSSASYAFCSFGTDCADCGPRRGSAPPRAPIGGSCVYDIGCEGYDFSFFKTQSWCIAITGAASGQAACVPNCTGDEGACTDGYECTGLTHADDGSPFTDADGNQAFACLPTVCR